MWKLLKFSCSMALVFMIVLAPTMSRAGLIPVLDSVSFVGGSYLYTYNVTLSAGSQVDNVAAHPDFVTLIDFYGYVPGTAQVLTSAPPTLPSEWTVTELASGPPAFLQSAPDSPTVTNISFKYTGPSVLIGPRDPVTNPPPALKFSLRSLFNVAPTDTAIYDGQTTATDTKGIQGNIGQYQGPTNIPESGSLAWLIGAGVTGSALVFRRRRSLA